MRVTLLIMLGVLMAAGSTTAVRADVIVAADLDTLAFDNLVANQATGTFTATGNMFEVSGNPNAYFGTFDLSITIANGVATSGNLLIEGDSGSGNETVIQSSTPQSLSYLGNGQFTFAFTQLGGQIDGMIQFFGDWSALIEQGDPASVFRTDFSVTTLDGGIKADVTSVTAVPLPSAALGGLVLLAAFGARRVKGNTRPRQGVA